MTGFLISAEKSLIWYPILFDTPHNAVRAVAIWLTLAIVIGYIVAFALLKDRPEWQKVRKFLFIGIIGFFSVVAITLLTFNFVEDGIVAILFYPILFLILAVAASGLMLSFRKEKATYIASGILIGLGILATLICIGIHFASGKAAEARDLDDVGHLVALAEHVRGHHVLCLAAHIVCDGEPFAGKEA